MKFDPSTGRAYRNLNEYIRDKKPTSVDQESALYAAFDKLVDCAILYDSEADTLRHIKRVNQLLLDAVKKLLDRAVAHDASKLQNPQKEYCDTYTPILAKFTYGSPEYTEGMKQFQYMFDHHNQTNSHHPEFYHKGIEQMDLFDVVEMLIDWKAATERHHDGDIYKSLEINKKRFGISDQLYSILLFTFYGFKVKVVK